MPRKKRYIYARRRTSGRRGVARGTAAAIIVAALIYFVVAGRLGTWLADKLIVPFMGGGQPSPSVQGELAASPTPSKAGETAGETAGATPTPTPPVTEELTLSPLPFYAIQLGAFSNQANAEGEARAIRERGAAGYIYEDAGRYRVLASAYLSRADADKVSAQLLSQQGLESYVLDMYTEGGAVTLRVTASGERIGGMQEAIDAWRASLDEIEEISRKLDLSEIGPELARSECRAAAERLIEKREALTGGAAVEGDGEPVRELGVLMDEEAASLLNISDDTGISAMEISSRIKYTYVDSLNRYGMLLRAIARA